MADVKEYIVRIKGDTSQLEAAADRAQAKFEKLSDTEVRLKVNFGKNNADIKPLLNEIKKVDPEIHTKMVIDGLEELRQTEERLEQIKKMEKDIGSGSVDAIRASLEKKFKDIQEAEKEAGTLDELDNSKVASGLKDVLNYIESIGKAADDVTISPLIKQIREFAGWYEDELAGFKPQNLLDQKGELQNRLSSLSKNIGDIPEQDQIEARISKYIDELYGIEDRIDAGLESDSSNLIKKLKEASDYLDQIEKKYGKIEGSDLVDELKGIRRERAAELDDYISRNYKGKKKEKAVKNKEIEKKDEPIDDDTFDSWLDEMDQEVKKTEKLTEARKEAANANKEEAPYESHVDEIKEETKSYEELAKAREKASKAEKLAHGLVDAQDKLFELEKERDELNKSSKPINARLLEAKHTDKYSDDEVKELEERKKKLVSAKGKNTKEQTKQKKYLKEHEQELYDELARLSTEISDLESRQYSLSDIDDEKQYKLLRKKLSLKKGDKEKIEEIGTYSGRDLKALLEAEYEYSKGKWENKADGGIYSIEGSTEISDTLEELKRAKTKLDGAKQYLEHPHNEDTVNYAHNLFSDTSSIEEETAAVEKNTQAKKDAKNVSKEEVPYESHADEINKEAEAYEEYAEAQREAEIEEEARRRTEKEMEEYERQTLERIEAEKSIASAADSVDKEVGSSDALIDANNQIGESAKEAEQKIKELENTVAELMSITSNASGGKLAIGEMIRNWIDSDKDIINRSGIKALLERSAVLDKDGNIYGGYSYGKAGKTGVSNATKERMKSSGVSPWAEFHSHSSAKIASASEADFIQFIKDYKEYGIAMQGIIAQDDIELFDMAAIMRDHKDKLEGLTKEDLIKKFKEGSLVSASSYFEDFISQYASNGLEEGLGYLGIALKNNGVDINLSDFKTIATDMMRDPNNKLAITELLINAVTGSMKDPSALNSQLESVIAQHTSGSTLASYFGYNDEDIQHYRRKAASKSIFQELFGTEDLSKYITHYTPDEFIEQNPLKLPDLSANENSMRNYAKATEEAADATAKLNKEEEKSVDNSDEHRKQQELAREYNEQLYESKGALPSPDDYDSYYDSDGISRFIEQTKEARIETENLNDAIRDGSVQSDDISKHTEDLKEDSKAANENAEANKKAAEAKKESASVQQEPERDLSAESLDLDKEASLRRLDVLEKKLREVGGASKELENDLVDARKAIGSAVDTKELGVANKKVRNITDDVNEYIKQKNIEVDYSDQLSSFEKLKNEIVESTAVSKAFKDSVKGAFDSFKDASASTKNIERIKEAIKETTKEFKEYAKASAVDNSKANTRFSNYVDRLNSYDLDKYTPEVRQKILDLRDEISKMPKDAAGNFKIDLNDEEVVKQVNRIDGAMKDLKAAVSSADGVVANGISVKKLNEQMAQFVNKNHKLTAEYKQEVKELRQALSEEGLTKSGYMDILGQYKDLQARASDEGLVGGVGNLENLGNQIKRMSTNFVAQYFSLYDIVRYAKEIGQSVTEINSAQTELRKVSDASQTRIQENFQKSAETAQEMGATISDVINSTSDWARLGYSVDEAEVLARNTALYQTVGDNMTQESASEYMTSIMKGYQYDADQSESIIDKVNEVANNYSIDTQGLGEALQRSASAFNTAHTDLDKSIAIITASNEVLQDPEKVGEINLRLPSQ